MKIIILEDVEFEGRKLVKGSTVILDSAEGKRIIETGKATPEDTNRSVGLKSSNVVDRVVRGKK